MFVVQLRFSKNEAHAGRHLEAHREWVSQGLSDGVFLIVGTIEPDAGGGIIAHNTTLAKLKQRIRKDPFVIENVVTSEIIEITPWRVADSIQPFLK